MLDGIVNDAIEARGLSLNPSHIGKTTYCLLIKTIISKDSSIEKMEIDLT